jgi:hypothetical protein
VRFQCEQKCQQEEEESSAQTVSPEIFHFSPRKLFSAEPVS